MTLGLLINKVALVIVSVLLVLLGSSPSAEAQMQMGASMTNMTNMTNMTMTAPCNGPGFYHLSCYKHVDAPTALAAKTQCLAAWETTNTTCRYGIDISGTKAYRCETYVLYHFSTKACHDAYQRQEKINTACTPYDAAKLGAPDHRLKPNVKEDYQCS
jgi:hypothetical protein